MNHNEGAGPVSGEMGVGRLNFSVDYSIKPIAVPYLDEIIAMSYEYAEKEEYIESFSHNIEEQTAHSNYTLLSYMGRTALARFDFPKAGACLNGLDGSIARALVGKIPVTDAPFRRIQAQITGPVS